MRGGAITGRPPCSVPSHTKWGHQRERRTPGCIVSKRGSSEGEQAISFPSPAIHHIRTAVWHAGENLCKTRWSELPRACVETSQPTPGSVLPVYVSFHHAFTTQDKNHRTLSHTSPAAFFCRLTRTNAFIPAVFSAWSHLSSPHHCHLHTLPLSTRYPISADHVPHKPDL